MTQQQTIRGVRACPECGCPIQRTTTGTIADGMRRHIETVHATERNKKV